MRGVANGDGIFYEQIDTVGGSNSKWRRGDICRDLHPSRDVEGHIERSEYFMMINDRDNYNYIVNRIMIKMPAQQAGREGMIRFYYILYINCCDIPRYIIDMCLG